MFWIIFSAVVTAVVFGGFAYYFYEDSYGDGLMIFIGCFWLAPLIAGLAGGATFGAGAGAAYFIWDHDDHYKTVELVAIRDTTSVGGSFFLGSGAVGGTGNYVFYYRDGNAKRLVNTDGSGVAVYEDTDKPYAKQFTGCSLSWAWVAPCFNNGDQWTEIHVPAGSIREGVNLNLGEQS